MVRVRYILRIQILDFAAVLRPVSLLIQTLEEGPFLRTAFSLDMIILVHQHLREGAAHSLMDPAGILLQLYVTEPQDQTPTRLLVLEVSTL
jgi:hypothetical protein